MNYDIKAQIETLFPEDRKKMDYEDSTVKGHQIRYQHKYTDIFHGQTKIIYFRFHEKLFSNV